MTAVMYTQEQLDIALLKNTQEGILREIHGLGTDLSDLRGELHSVSSDLRTELHSMREKMKSQGHWNIGLILGIYGLIVATALGKIFGVL